MYCVLREECQAQVDGFSGADFRGFSARAEADQFATGGQYSSAARSSYSGDFVSRYMWVIAMVTPYTPTMP